MEEPSDKFVISIADIESAVANLQPIIKKTPLELNERLSQQLTSRVYFKREDQQIVRSFKIRGAYNRMVSLTEEEKSRGVVCASAGNHAQGVAFSCKKLNIKGTIFMPIVTPHQKIERVQSFGNGLIDIKLFGNTFDEAYEASHKFSQELGAVYIHPFNDSGTIAGQGTIGYEIFQELGEKVDFIIIPIGGGGLASGIASYFKQVSPTTKIIGVEPTGAASMYESLINKEITSLKTIDTFADGVAVKTPGDLTFHITKDLVDQIVIVPEGKVATTMIELYQQEGIITEPAGALSVAALDLITDQIKNKTAVCIISGGNNDLLRYNEILEKSLVSRGLKHYFIVEFAQKPGQLKKFVNEVLGPNDDIVRFEYIKKTNKEKGPALVGIEQKSAEDYQQLIDRFNNSGINYRVIQNNELLYQYIV